MKISDIFIRAGHNLRESKARTILTSLAIAVGATTITLALAAGAAGRAYIDQQAESQGVGKYAYINVTTKQEQMTEAFDKIQKYDEPTEANTTSPSNKQQDSLYEKDIEKIRNIEGVERVVPRYQISPEYTQLKGQDDKFVLDVINNDISLESKTKFTVGEEPKQPGELSISQDFAEAFNVAPSEIIGKQIDVALKNKKDELRTFSFKVTGVQSLDGQRKKYSVTSEDARAMQEYQMGTDAGVGSAFVGLDNTISAATVVSSIDSAGYSGYSSQDGAESFIQAVNIAQWGLVGFGGIALLAAVFGIVNTQYISVLERTRHIGLMKAVGAGRKDIARLFRLEAAWVGLLGATAGVIVAWLISLSAPLLKSMMDLGETDIQLFIFEPLSVALIILTLMFIAMAAGYFPSRKAAKLDPIEALRSE